MYLCVLFAIISIVCIFAKKAFQTDLNQNRIYIKPRLAIVHDTKLISLNRRFTPSDIDNTKGL